MPARPGRTAQNSSPEPGPARGRVWALSPSETASPRPMQFRARKGGEKRAWQGSSPRGVLCTRGGDDAARRRFAAASPERSPLPAVVGERLVRLGHAVDVLFALERAALVVLGVEEL